MAKIMSNSHEHYSTGELAPRELNIVLHVPVQLFKSLPFLNQCY